MTRARRRRGGTAAASAALIALVLLSGCGGKRSKSYTPFGKPGYTEIGLASWYGKPYHGRKTSSGERYDMHEMTAAHRTLPFGTWVEVTALATGRDVRVRINDRGPFVKGRIIDLSYAAAKKLRMVKEGVVEVRMVVVRK